MGTAPPGRSASSKASSSPPVLPAVSVKVKRSPVTGFSSVWPGISMPPVNTDRMRLSMAVSRDIMRERLHSWPMDAVAGLLDGPRARGAFLLRSTMDPPWSLRIEDEAPVTLVAVVRGEAWIVPDGRAPERLGAGDVAVVRGPEPYTVADDPATAPQAIILPGQRCTTPDGQELAQMMDLGVRTWGNAADGATVMLTGTYQLDGEVSRRLLRALPTLLVL